MRKVEHRHVEPPKLCDHHTLPLPRCDLKDSLHFLTSCLVPACNIDDVHMCVRTYDNWTMKTWGVQQGKLNSPWQLTVRRPHRWDGVPPWNIPWVKLLLGPTEHRPRQWISIHQVACPDRRGKLLVFHIYYVSPSRHQGSMRCDQTKLIALKAVVCLCPAGYWIWIWNERSVVIWYGKEGEHPVGQLLRWIAKPLLPSSTVWQSRAPSRDELCKGMCVPLSGYSNRDRLQGGLPNGPRIAGRLFLKLFTIVWSGVPRYTSPVSYVPYQWSVPHAGPITMQLTYFRTYTNQWNTENTKSATFLKRSIISIQLLYKCLIYCV